MYINKIKIHNFRIFQKECELDLNKNINIIAGLNGSGKSTLLTILTNVGELTKINDQKVYLLNGEKFRGEFADVIMYDENHDDKTGDKAEIYFNNLPNDLNKYNVSEKIIFRAHTSTKNSKTISTSRGRTKKIQYTRYRLIPKKTKKHNSEAKVIWPSYYLGLSRLAPLGEAISVNKKLKIDNEYNKKIFKTHSKILNENLNLQDAQVSNLDIYSAHPKSTISTKMYGDVANSSGQDNAGQIIEAVYSFEKLKKEYPDEYIGGIIAIDELDASLHPAAQNNLIDWLIKKSKELDLQIVATTHSLSMLQHICDIRKTKIKKNITINYLIQRGEKIHVEKNQPFSFYKNTLRETYEQSPNKKINVFTEDEIARWFIKESMKLLDYDNKNLNFLDVNISWSHLLNLLNSDYENFSNYIFILDGDIKQDIIKYMEKYVPCNFNFNDDEPKKSDILCLPCDQPIEKKLFEYVNNLSDDDELFSDPFMIRNGIVNKKIIEKFTKETRENYPKNNGQNTEFYKHWFRDERHQKYMNVFLKYWIEDNKKIVKKFLDSIKAKTGQILSKSNLLY